MKRVRERYKMSEKLTRLTEDKPKVPVLRHRGKYKV